MAHEANELQHSLAEYMRFERNSPTKHEYAAGHIFAMAGASERHNRIAGNLHVHLHLATRNSDCVAFISDMRVRIDQVVYYPDLMVCCEAADDDPYLKHSPCLIVEVLSESTERIDRGEKLYNYRQINTLQAYVLVAQEQRRVEVWRRAEDASWSLRSYSDLDETIALPCPPTTLTLAQIYERIVF